jgi:uncharacterized protein (DUF58 family)
LIPEFHYRFPWRSHRAHPGHHGSLHSGGGDEFLGYAPLTAHPDPRKIDSRASLQDPFGQLMVRVFRQRSSIPIYVLADLSASMGFGWPNSKLATVAAFAEATAYSAHRTGDPFGFFACEAGIRWDLHLPLRWHKSFPVELRAALWNLTPTAASAEGLRAVAPLLGRQRSLVFLLSDFHLSQGETEAVFDSLLHHDVVPIVLWREAEFENLPLWGWIMLEDPENGDRRRLFMRPALRQAFIQRFAERRAELTALCLRHGRKPFFIDNEIDAEALTRYFLNG